MRIVWNADSTFEASSAEVSMNDKPFSAVRDHESIVSVARGRGHGKRGLTSKALGLVRRHCPQVLQIALVSDEHDDDVRVRVVAELFQPPRHVHVCRMFGDVVDEKRTDCAAVVPAPGIRE